jgi:hypothetical protein
MSVLLAKAGIASQPNRDGWYTFERSTALLYMSLLAKYVADVDVQSTVPGTDNRAYEKLIYDAESPRTGMACIDARFVNALPIPREDASLPQIVAFKRRRRGELLSFRERIEDFQKQLSQAEDRSHVKDLVTSFANSIEKELMNLEATLKDSKIATTSGCFKTIINVKSPAFWGALGTAVVVAQPMAWALAGVAVAGAIEVGCHWVAKRNEERAVLRKDSISFLYHARKEGLV